MKLKEFNPENCLSIKSGTPAISINCKTGLMAVNKWACEHIGLKENHQVKLYQDEEEKGDWYLEIVKDNGFALRKKDNVSAGLFMNNISLLKEIAASVAFTGKSGRLLVAGKPTSLNKRVLWGLLTNTLKNK